MSDQKRPKNVSELKLSEDYHSSTENQYDYPSDILRENAVIYQYVRTAYEKGDCYARVCNKHSNRKRRYIYHSAAGTDFDFLMDKNLDTTFVVNFPCRLEKFANLKTVFELEVKTDKSILGKRKAIEHIENLRDIKKQHLENEEVDVDLDNNDNGNNHEEKKENSIRHSHRLRAVDDDNVRDEPEGDDYDDNDNEDDDYDNEDDDYDETEDE
jgi:hypothetical protein